MYPYHNTVKKRIKNGELVNVDILADLKLREDKIVRDNL